MPANHVSSVRPSRLDALKNKHADLSRQVEELQKSVSVNDLMIRALKLEKLTVKEQIVWLEEQRTAGSA